MAGVLEGFPGIRIDIGSFAPRRTQRPRGKPNFDYVALKNNAASGGSVSFNEYGRPCIGTISA